MNPILTGLDLLLADPDRYLKGRNVGLAVNHTSLAADGRHSIEHFSSGASRFVLKKIFAPEHGLYGVDQDMVSVGHGRDPLSGAPVVSLYGDRAESLTPAPDLLADLDTLIFDIQDIGSRYYTFIYTLANCMRACREKGVPIVVCDRPNPINGAQVEGNLVGTAWRSFVGQYPLPNRHGMTVGELALLFNDDPDLRCNLTVIPLRGWKRAMWHEDTGLTWVAPSPNMPAVATAAVYPGMCMIEGTHLSEGRGTTLPFEQTGAPYIDPHALARALRAENLPGVYFRPHFFKPTFHKWAQQVCGGIQIHVTGRARFKPVLTGIAVIRAIATLYPGEFRWRAEPYEFVSDRPAIDLLYGNAGLREKLIRASLADIEASWQEELQSFLPLRQNHLLY